jgi:hypothetical protein
LREITYNIGDVVEGKLGDSNDDNYDPEIWGYWKTVKCEGREEGCWREDAEVYQSRTR